MQPIDTAAVQEALNRFANHDVYIHLETTNGAYASHHNDGFYSVGAYIRNACIRFTRGKITGPGPYRVGLKLDLGWVYAEGLTHWEWTEKGQLLLAGHDDQGKLAVALELSNEPFV
ncbi:YojF family protein [Geobacillus thermoleovorans]|uniref:YojF family protein n=1 Tax=Geobacillus thermoleovorans TaxID=33941 RepID=UPI003D23677E